MVSRRDNEVKISDNVVSTHRNLHRGEQDQGRAGGGGAASEGSVGEQRDQEERETGNTHLSSMGAVVSTS